MYLTKRLLYCIWGNFWACDNNPHLRRVSNKFTDLVDYRESSLLSRYSKNWTASFEERLPNLGSKMSHSSKNLASPITSFLSDSVKLLQMFSECRIIDEDLAYKGIKKICNSIRNCEEKISLEYKNKFIRAKNMWKVL